MSRVARVSEIAEDRTPVNALVPAVERAIGVLRHLQDNPEPTACTVSNVARVLGLHKSSCSNILRTLEAAGFVEYDVNSKSYRLGPDLIGLGASAAKHRGFLQIAMPHLEWLVRQTGFTCVAFEQLPASEFVVVAKVDSPKDIKVTIDVGQHFPPSAPAMARIALAWKEDAEIEAYLARWGLPGYTLSTKTDRSEVHAELKAIREQGYALSLGEYYAANTAISAPVFSRRDQIMRGICLVGFSSEITEAERPMFGQRVRAAAEAITRALGGRDARTKSA
jgi:IclR family acetate operon transcriptional repressor